MPPGPGRAGCGAATLFARPTAGGGIPRIHSRSGQVLNTVWANVRLSDGTTIGIGQDMTAREQQTERLQAILDNIPLMINSFDSQGRLLWANRCWEKTLGWSLEEAQANSGNMLEKLYPDPDYRQSILENIRLADGHWKDCVNYTRDGRWVMMSVGPISAFRTAR